MYCQNCGKQISSIANDCPYCKAKVNSNIDNQNNYSKTNQQEFKQTNNKPNNVLYYGMNGKPVTIWKFIIGAILLIGGIYVAISSVL